MAALSRASDSALLDCLRRSAFGDFPFWVYIIKKVARNALLCVDTLHATLYI